MFECISFNSYLFEYSNGPLPVYEERDYFWYTLYFYIREILVFGPYAFALNDYGLYGGNIICSSISLVLNVFRVVTRKNNRSPNKEIDPNSAFIQIIADIYIMHS